MRVEKLARSIQLARPRHQRAAGGRGQERRRYPTFETALDGHARAWDELWEVCDVRASARGARPVPAAFPHLASPPGVLAADRPPRRRRPGARPQRRGISRARLLGRALRLSLPQLPAADGHARAARCTATGGSPRRARRHAKAAIEGAMYPWQSGSDGAGADPDRPPQPAVRAVGAGPQPQPAPRQRGDLLHRLALPPGDARLRLPARLRRRDDARDRPLLVLDRALQPGARSVGDPRRHGPGRVPREVSRARPRGACATTRTRTSWWPGSATPRSKVLELLPAEPPRRPAGADRPDRRGDPARGRR